MVNQCNFVGIVGKDPESRAAGTHTIVTFSLGVKSEKKGGDTVWVNCQAWNKTGETIKQHCTKGAVIFVSTKFELQEWESEGTKKSKPIFTVQNFSIITWPKKQEDNNSGGNYDDAPAF